MIRQVLKESTPTSWATRPRGQVRARLMSQGETPCPGKNRVLRF